MMRACCVVWGGVVCCAVVCGVVWWGGVVGGGVVWCVVGWCVLWCGVVSGGVVCCGVVWCGVLCCARVLYDALPLRAVLQTFLFFPSFSSSPRKHADWGELFRSLLVRANQGTAQCGPGTAHARRPFMCRFAFILRMVVVFQLMGCTASPIASHSGGESQSSAFECRCGRGNNNSDR